MSVPQSTKEIFTAEPIEGKAEVLHEKFRIHLQEQFVRSIQKVEELLSIDLSSVKRVFSQLEQGLPFSPNLYALYWRLLNAVRSGMASELKEVLKVFINLSRSEIYKLGFELRSLDNSHADIAIAEFVSGPEGPKSLTGEDARMYPVPSEVIDLLLDSAESAIDVVRKTDEGVIDEFDEYVRSLSIFAGKVATGITSVRAFGGIYLREPSSEFSKAQRVAYFVEHLVHETSHLQLHALMIHDPLLLNDDEQLFDAPIRPDPRPMFGIFHASFVLSRMVRVFRKWSQNDSSPLLQDHLRKFESMFQHGLQTVQSHGVLTTAGKSVFGSLRKVALMDVK